MIERYIAPALTFAVLIAGHLAIVSALLSGPSYTAEPAQVATASVAAKRAG